MLSRSKGKTKTHSPDVSVSEIGPAKRDHSMPSEACTQRTVTDSYNGPEQSSAADAEASREHVCGPTACASCVDLCIASSAR
eukprot:3529372-Pleurochrysis_carterae.AAC.1